MPVIKSVMPVRLPLVIERLLLGGVFSYALDPLARPGDPIHLERLRIRHVLMQDWITSLRSHNAVRLVGVIKRYRHEPCSLEGRWRRTASRKLAAIKGSFFELCKNEMAAVVTARMLRLSAKSPTPSTQAALARSAAASGIPRRGRK